MDINEALDVIREQHRAVLATLRRDGSPQLSPVTCAVDADGRVVISSRRTAYKVKNLERNPSAWLCVLPDEFFGRWIQVEGPVEIMYLPEAMEPLVDYYRTAAGKEHPDWADYRTAMEREQRVLIRIDPTRAGPDRAG